MLDCRFLDDRGASDVRKNDILDALVAPDMVRYHFLKSRASGSRKPRPFDGHNVSEAQRGGP